jgi:hypothetical protein
LCNVMSDIGCRREQRAPAINTTSARAHPHTPILPTSMCAASNINISCTCTFACSSMCMCMYTDLPAMYHVHQSYDVYMIYDMVIYDMRITAPGGLLVSTCLNIHSTCAKISYTRRYT